MAAFPVPPRSELFTLPPQTHTTLYPFSYDSDPITSTINLPAAAAPAAAAAHAHKSFNDPTLSNTELTPGLGPTSYLSNFCCPETAFSSCNLTAQPPTHQQQVPTRLSSRTFPTSHPSLPPPPPPSPLTLVLTSTDLTHSILSFLLTSAQPETARNQLAALSLLSRRWRTLTSWDR